MADLDIGTISAACVAVDRVTRREKREETQLAWAAAHATPDAFTETMTKIFGEMEAAPVADAVGGNESFERKMRARMPGAFR